MWDPPGPGIEPVFPALAGGFLTTAPKGKPRLCFVICCLIKNIHREQSLEGYTGNINSNYLLVVKLWKLKIPLSVLLYFLCVCDFFFNTTHIYIGNELTVNSLELY